MTGYPVCQVHGAGSPKKGRPGGRPPIHGRYSLRHRQELAGKYDRFLEDPKPADLSEELALMRALLQDYLERFPEGMPLPADDIGRLYGMIEAVSKLVERIARILSQAALTAVEVQFLQARIADLIVKYIDDPIERTAFVAELQEALGVQRGHSGARPALVGAGAAGTAEGEA